MTSPAIALRAERTQCIGLFWRRLMAVVQRHVYLYIGSWPRFVETLFWPMLNMLMLGFVSLYMLRQFTSATVVASIMIAGTMLNEIMLRTTMGLMVMFLEEIWSRNLGHLFASPLKLSDYIIAGMGFTFVKSIVSILPAIAVAMMLFHFSIFRLGWALLPFTVLLIMNGWWYGMLVISLLLRFGMAAEWMAWMSTWLIVPLLAPYYPVAILPHWMQPISWSLPATYVFESMKLLLAGGDMEGGYLLAALALNVFYTVVAAFVLHRTYQGTRRRGGLLQIGE